MQAHVAKTLAETEKTKCKNKKARKNLYFDARAKKRFDKVRLPFILSEILENTDKLRYQKIIYLFVFKRGKCINEIRILYTGDSNLAIFE